MLNLLALANLAQALAASGPAAAAAAAACDTATYLGCYRVAVAMSQKPNI